MAAGLLIIAAAAISRQYLSAIYRLAGRCACALISPVSRFIDERFQDTSFREVPLAACPAAAVSRRAYAFGIGAGFSHIDEAYRLQDGDFARAWACFRLHLCYGECAAAFTL